MRLRPTVAFSPKTHFPPSVQRVQNAHVCARGVICSIIALRSATAVGAQRCSRAGCRGGSGPHAGIGPRPNVILLYPLYRPALSPAHSPPFLWRTTWEAAGCDLSTAQSRLRLQGSRLAVWDRGLIVTLDRWQLFYPTESGWKMLA